VRLVVLTEDFYPSVSGGAHEQWRFCQIAAREGHDVTVFTPRKGDLARRETVDGVDVRRPFRSAPASLPAYGVAALVVRLLFSVALFWYVLWTVRSDDADAFYSGSNTLHWVGTALGRLTGRPAVSYVGFTPSLYPDEQPAAKLWLERQNFAHCLGDRVFCRVPAVRELVAARSERPVEIVHGILNADRVRAVDDRTDRESLREEYAGPGERLLVYLGRLSEEKNPTGAVATVAALPHDYRLVLVGDGPDRDAVTAAVDAHGVGERVTRTGELDHGDALAVVAAADALVLPSHVEAYPTVAFEGLALGCRVFATPVGILPEIDHPRLHCSPVEAFPAAIREVSFEGIDRLDEDVLERYSMERFARGLLDGIEGAAAERKSEGEIR